MTRSCTSAPPSSGRSPATKAATRSSSDCSTLLRRGAEHGCELVVFPELALTTFFPRWFLDEGDDTGIAGDTTELDSYYETAMPSPATQPLFDEAKRLGVGFCLGYAELTPDGHRYNTYVLVDRAGEIVGKYRKVHIPGHENHEPWRQFQHLERRYFEESHEGFGVHEAFGGTIGMAICNDRRWPETYRVMGLQGAELILIGYNTPLDYAPDPSQNPLQSFHNQLVMQAGAYQNGTWVVGVAKGGIEEGVESLAQSVIIAPSGQIVAQADQHRRRADHAPAATSTCATATRRRCSTSTAIGDPRCIS